jgi:hypothetical protein
MTIPDRYDQTRSRSLGLRDEDGTAVLRELQGLCCSLPWVVQLPSVPGEPTLRRFAVECPPLGCSSVWLLMGRFDAEDGVIELLAALPRTLADRGMAAGWAVSIADDDHGRVVVGVATPTTALELRALEALLIVAYTNAFVTNAGAS